MTGQNLGVWIMAYKHPVESSYILWLQLMLIFLAKEFMNRLMKNVLVMGLLCIFLLVDMPSPQFKLGLA